MFGVKSERWEAATVLSGSLAVEGRASGPVGIMASGEAFRGYLQRQADPESLVDDSQKPLLSPYLSVLSGIL